MADSIPSNSVSTNARSLFTSLLSGLGSNLINSAHQSRIKSQLALLDAEDAEYKLQTRNKLAAAKLNKPKYTLLSAADEESAAAAAAAAVKSNNKIPQFSTTVSINSNNNNNNNINNSLSELEIQQSQAISRYRSKRADRKKAAIAENNIKSRSNQSINNGDDSNSDTEELIPISTVDIAAGNTGESLSSLDDRQLYLNRSQRQKFGLKSLRKSLLVMDTALLPITAEDQIELLLQTDRDRNNKAAIKQAEQINAAFLNEYSSSSSDESEDTELKQSSPYKARLLVNNSNNSNNQINSSAVSDINEHSLNQRKSNLFHCQSSSYWPNDGKYATMNESQLEQKKQQLIQQFQSIGNENNTETAARPMSSMSFNSHNNNKDNNSNSNTNSNTIRHTSSNIPIVRSDAARIAAAELKSKALKAGFISLVRHSVDSDATAESKQPPLLTDTEIDLILQQKINQSLRRGYCRNQKELIACRGNTAAPNLALNSSNLDRTDTDPVTIQLASDLAGHSINTLSDSNYNELGLKLIKSKQSNCLQPMAKTNKQFVREPDTKLNQAFTRMNAGYHNNPPIGSYYTERYYLYMNNNSSIEAAPILPVQTVFRPELPLKYRTEQNVPESLDNQLSRDFDRFSTEGRKGITITKLGRNNKIAADDSIFKQQSQYRKELSDPISSIDLHRGSKFNQAGIGNRTESQLRTNTAFVDRRNLIRQYAAAMTSIDSYNNNKTSTGPAYSFGSSGTERELESRLAANLRTDYIRNQEQKRLKSQQQLAAAADKKKENNQWKLNQTDTIVNNNNNDSNTAASASPEPIVRKFQPQKPNKQRPQTARN